jgi:hypothetical protein
VNPDQSAIVGVYNDWANSDGTSDFTTNAIEFREGGMAMYFLRPQAPVQLDGKTFQVQSLTHYYQLNQAPVAAEEIAGRLIVKRGIGSIKFEGANAIFNLTEELFVYGYPNDDINQPAQLISITQPVTISRSLLSPSETAEDGCFFFSELPNSLFCTNGQSMLMRESNDAAGASSLDKFLTLVTGSLLQ